MRPKPLRLRTSSAPAIGVTWQLLVKVRAQLGSAPLHLIDAVTRRVRRAGQLLRADFTSAGCTGAPALPQLVRVVDHGGDVGVGQLLPRRHRRARLAVEDEVDLVGGHAIDDFRSVERGERARHALPVRLVARRAVGGEDARAPRNEILRSHPCSGRRRSPRSSASAPRPTPWRNPPSTSPRRRSA